MYFRNKGSATGWAASFAGLFLTVLIVIATFRVGVDKNLVGTFTTHEWGRYFFSVGAALTQLKGGPGDYVIDNVIENKLSMGGFTESPQWLDPLGSKFPDNLHNEALLQHALDGALLRKAAFTGRIPRTILTAICSPRLAIVGRRRPGPETGRPSNAAGASRA
jgi:hypothetical protein